MVRGGTGTPEEIAKYGELRNTLFMGNTLRGMLLEAYAFGTLGVIAGYSAIAALAGGILTANYFLSQGYFTFVVPLGMRRFNPQLSVGG